MKLKRYSPFLRSFRRFTTKNRPQLLQIASQGCITESYHWGLGQKDSYLLMDPAMPWINMTKWIYISIVPGVTCSITARISITLLLISLFGTKKWFKSWLVATTSLVAIMGALCVILTWTQASPVEGLWNPLLPARRWDPLVAESMIYVAGCELRPSNYYICLLTMRLSSSCLCFDRSHLCAVPDHHHR